MFMCKVLLEESLPSTRLWWEAEAEAEAEETRFPNLACCCWARESGAWAWRVAASQLKTAAVPNEKSAG